MVKNYHCVALPHMRRAASAGFATTLLIVRFGRFRHYISNVIMSLVYDGFGAEAGIQIRRNIAKRVAEIAKRDAPPLFSRLSLIATELALLCGIVRPIATGRVRLPADALPEAERLDIRAVCLARPRFQIFRDQPGRRSQRLLRDGGRVCGAPPQTIPLRLLVIGELETVLDGPMAFSSGEPVAYATGSPTIGQGVWRRIGRRQTARRGFHAPGRRVPPRPIHNRLAVRLLGLIGK